MKASEIYVAVRRIYVSVLHDVKLLAPTILSSAETSHRSTSRGPARCDDAMMKSSDGRWKINAMGVRSSKVKCLYTPAAL